MFDVGVVGGTDFNFLVCVKNMLGKSGQKPIGQFNAVDITKRTMNEKYGHSES